MAKINVNKEVKKSAGFKPRRDINEGLNLGFLIKVEVTEEEKPKINDKGQEDAYEYAGFMIPTLRFTFHNFVLPEAIDKAERIFQHSEKPIVSTRNDGNAIDSKWVISFYENMFDRILHLYTVYTGTDNYQALEDLPEIDENAPVEKRIKQFKTFFTKVADAFNKAKSGNPVFVDSKNNNIVLWMKLLPEPQNGYFYAFPQQVKQGFVELYKPGVPPVIEVKPSESLELRSNSKEKKEAGDGTTKHKATVTDFSQFNPAIAEALAKAQGK